MENCPSPPLGFVLYDPSVHADWPETDMCLLDEARGAVPPFPLGLLPPLWARWIGDTARSIGAPVDYVAQGTLAAVAAVCGAGVRAQVSPGWSESLVLWQALVGSPSSGKSPALAAARRQIGEIEDALRDGDAQRRGQHAGRVERDRATGGRRPAARRVRRNGAERWPSGAALAGESGAALGLRGLGEPCPFRHVESATRIRSVP